MSRNNRAFILAFISICAVGVVCYAATLAQLLKDGYFVSGPSTPLTATSGYIPVADGTKYAECAMSGDTTIASGGAVTIGNAKVTAAKMVNAGVFTGDATTTFPALTIGNGAITAAKMVNAGVFTGDATTTFPALTIGNGAITAVKMVNAGVFTGDATTTFPAVTVSKIGGSTGSSGQILKGGMTFGLAMQYEAKSSGPVTLALADNMALVDCDVSGGGFTVTLPAAATVGQGYTVWLRVNNNTPSTSATNLNALTVACNSADGVAGMNALTSTLSTLYLYRQGECIGLQSTGVAGYRAQQGWNVLTYVNPAGSENVVCNPNGVVAQRPANGTSPGSGNYVYGTVDRWLVACSAAPTLVVAQDTSIWTTGNPTGYAVQATVTVTTGAVIFRQVLEAKDCVQFQNRAAVFSANVWQDTGSSVNFIMNVYTNTAADNNLKTFLNTPNTISSGNLGSNQAVATSTATTICSGPVQLGSSAKNGIIIEIKTASLSPTAKHFEITDVCLQPGTITLPPRLRSYSEELARCQRYYFSLNATGEMLGAIVSSNSMQGYLKNPVTMFKATPICTAPGLTGFGGPPSSTQIGAYDYALAGYVVMGSGTASVSTSSATADQLSINFQTSGSFTGVTAGQLVGMVWGSSVNIQMDADF